MWPSSAMESQTRSLISQQPILGGRLDPVEGKGLEPLERLEETLNARTDRLQLGVGPREPAESSQAPQGLNGYFHGREHTTRMKGHGRCADDHRGSERPYLVSQ